MNRVAAQELFDPAPLRELADYTDLGFVRELVDLFLRDAPPRLEAMRAAVGEADHEELWQQAHALRGGAAMVGAAAVAELCELFEQPKDGVASAVLVERVGEAYAQTVEPLRAGVPMI